MIELLVCLPIGAALIALAIPSNRWRPCVLPLAALLHLVLSFQAILAPTMHGTSNWLVLDPLGKIFLGLISVLFFLVLNFSPCLLSEAAPSIAIFNSSSVAFSTLRQNTC